MGLKVRHLVSLIAPKRSLKLVRQPQGDKIQRFHVLIPSLGKCRGGMLKVFCELVEEKSWREMDEEVAGISRGEKVGIGADFKRNTDDDGMMEKFGALDSKTDGGGLH